jgi:cyclase
MSRPIYSSAYFDLEPLADGVFAALSTDPRWATSNAGFVNLGDRTLVFDSFASPKAAEELRKAAEQETGHTVSWVINSHFHGDHVRGNQAFTPQAGVVASGPTRQRIAGSAERIERARKTWPQAILDLREQAAKESDSEKRRSLQEQVEEMEDQLSVFATLQLTPPQLTFEQRLTFHGSRRSAIAITFAGGHTDSDSVLWLPQDRILFAGDLLFRGGHPWTGDGDLRCWVKILDQLQALEPSVIIPGHGPVATVGDLAFLRRYLTDIDDLLQNAILSGLSREEVEKLPVPAPYAGLTHEGMYRESLTLLYDKRSATSSSSDPGD